MLPLKRATEIPGHEPWVILDHVWAHELGISRSGGIYRVSRRELRQKLEMLEAERLQAA